MVYASSSCSITALEEVNPFLIPLLYKKVLFDHHAIKPPSSISVSLKFHY